ncbi:ABC transporter substrate-binding protein [Tardiphaga sp. 866_E4_N2_1]|uniref:ABC transporter substrate-binding protein n=1 Tax=unclassified Tardiphaga TaxID=2631404 RepID=UPI003F293317
MARMRSVVLSATLVSTVFTVGAAGGWFQARAQGGTIKFGELNSYNRYAANTVPARYGWQLAQDEINASGGILGRKLEIVSLDDGSTPTDALRAAEQLITREGVSALFGAWQSNVGIAIGGYANRQKVPYIATIPISNSLTMENGNPYTFRLRPSLHMQIEMLGDEIAKVGPKRWAIVAPNYEFGHSAAETFKRVLRERSPNAEVAVEQYPALGKIDAGALANALEAAKPDAIFSALFAADTAQFARDGKSRGLFEGRTVISLATGEPEVLRALGADVPEGWIVTGYPYDQITTPAAHKAFIDNYMSRFKEAPTSNSMLAYISVYTLKAAAEKAGSADSQALAKALRDIRVDTIAGPIRMRGLDNQSTLGYWIGKTTTREGKGAMTDWTYVGGENFLFPESEVRAVRKE